MNEDTKRDNGASIKPVKKRRSHLEITLEEALTEKVIGPFNSTKELMDDLLS